MPVMLVTHFHSAPITRSALREIDASLKKSNIPSVGIQNTLVTRGY